QRMRVVAGRMMPREVALKDLDESPVQPKLGVIGVTPVRLRRLEPPLEPQQEHREQVALQIHAARVCWPPCLFRQGSDDRLYAWNVLCRTRHLVGDADARHPGSV